ncbi:ExbD/TolR family protein [Candidatus Laterigemmans baculatus]|uniref:ExbD/TolR family protein n=1 Tax=Candidatus Laterigemmans baculatus TaxID=2770505 RepID=UPI0013D95625|nr:biopolymer transporter ExbD [Candidatus Laterigemmans baculatus]
MKIRNHEPDTKVELQMTSMIDVVFLLLIFFILTFKIVELEGDFSIRMPLASTDAGQMDDSQLPIKLRLIANEQGQLTSILLNDNNLGTDFDQLRASILGIIGTDAGPVPAGEGPEVEIDTDYNLRYENVVNAITAVSGYKVDGQPVKLIEKIKFAPPRRE